MHYCIYSQCHIMCEKVFLGHSQPLRGGGGGGARAPTPPCVQHGLVLFGWYNLIWISHTIIQTQDQDTLQIEVRLSLLMHLFLGFSLLKRVRAICCNISRL